MMLKQLLNNRKGFGVKEIAVTLGFIVVVGLIITSMQGRLGGWLDDVWGFVQQFIQDNIKG
jgi:Flp pilus assembly pilin Flp